MEYFKKEGSQTPVNVIKAAFALSDSDKSGQIEKKEFTRFFRLIEETNKNNFQKALFEIADTKNQQILTQKELKIICAELKWAVPDNEQMNLE